MNFKDVTSLRSGKNITHALLNLIRGPILPSRNWSEEYACGVVNYENGKTFLVDPSSELKDYYAFPEQLNASQGDRVAVGKLYLDSELVLESYINLSTREQKVVDNPKTPLGGNCLSFLGRAKNTFFSFFCALPGIGVLMTLTAIHQFGNWASLCARYLWPLFFFTLLSSAFCIYSLIYIPQHVYLLTVIMFFVLFCGELLYGIKIQAAVSFLSSGRESFNQKFPKLARESLPDVTEGDNDLKNTRLTEADRKIFVVLVENAEAVKAKREDRKAFVKRVEISDRAGVSEPSVTRAIKKLKDVYGYEFDDSGCNLK